MWRVAIRDLKLQPDPVLGHQGAYFLVGDVERFRLRFLHGAIRAR